MKSFLLISALLISFHASSISKSCRKDSECGKGFQCAPVKGEFPGSCAEGLKQVQVKKKGCMKDSDCPKGKVCASIKGEFPGGCADGLR